MVTVGSRSKPKGRQSCIFLLLGIGIGWTFKALAGVDSVDSTINIEKYSSLHGIRAAAHPSSTNKSSYDMALNQSLGFFDDIPEEEWKYRQQIAIDRWDHRRGNFMSEAKKPFALWYLNNYEPFFSCPLERRVLGVGEGPKWVCDPHRIAKAAKRRSQGCLVYSVGSHGKFNFESGIQELIPDCDIHVFDPGNYAKQTPARYNFHQWALTSSWVKDWVPMLSNRTLHNTMFMADERLKTFQQTVKALGHENRVIDILKIDCESCEWVTWRDWLTADVRQILVETHDVPKVAPDFFDELFAAGYVLFHKEPNIHPGSSAGGGFGVEWAFLKLDKEFTKGWNVFV